MEWIFKVGDILEEPADVLICSANVFLNLSGGVGGEILLRFGDAMQRELHAYLRERGLRHVEPGDVIATSGGGSRFRAVLHAVAVDGFYQTSADVITALVEKSLTMAASLGATRVALTALGTGFGRLTMSQFAEGILPLQARQYPPIEHVIVCVRKTDEREQIARAIQGRDHRPQS
jgi:O-acetyl-ADP-ribose deacetylase (regulator of RNase III)